MLSDAGSGLLAECRETILDCTNASDVNRSIYLDKSRPLAFPAIRCGGESARVLRVFTGKSCRLWQQENTARCFWNATKQAFVGAGCVAANGTACACLHLTGAPAAGADRLHARPHARTTQSSPFDLIRRENEALRAPQPGPLHPTPAERRFRCGQRPQDCRA